MNTSVAPSDESPSPPRSTFRPMTIHRAGASTFRRTLAAYKHSPAHPSNRPAAQHPSIRIPGSTAPQDADSNRPHPTQFFGRSMPFNTGGLPQRYSAVRRAVAEVQFSASLAPSDS